ncbi:MAG: long-chain fatty acid--CoA ligase [Propionicimonas sp.]
MDAGHLAVRFLTSASAHSERPATRVREDGVWRTQSYADLAADVRLLAAHLIASGLNPGDRVAIIAPNLPEWSLVDLGCLTAGLVPVPLYATSTVDQVRHILADAGCAWVFVAGSEEAEKVLAVRDDLPGLERIVSFTELPDAPEISTLAAELGAAPKTLDGVDERLEAASADDLATIIYTSGTTGEPKGVMLSHRGFTHQIDVLNQYFTIAPHESSLCFLPLSHALERAWTYVVLTAGCLNTYVPNPRAVAEMLVKAEPTMLVSVPRLYEKVYLAAQEKVADSPVKERLMAWALRVGADFHTRVHEGRPRSKSLIVQFKIADKLVLSSVREAMGGPKTVLACGGAPLRQEVEEFFLACGLLVLQGYGLTEASPLVTFPSPSGFRFGTVGQVMDGGEVALGEDGEILYRGPNVMLGYWNKPDDTAATLVDGWLRTGDVGEVDADGYLRITDRIKDLIVTSNGKNVAPAPIEGLLASDPLFEYTLLLGDNRPYLTLLVSPSMPHLEEIGKQLQISWAHRDELFTNPAVLAEIKRRVGELTQKLAQHEQIRDLRLLVEEFTQENGLLTPTLKVKRREVEKRFAQIVDEMYSRVGKPRN